MTIDLQAITLDKKEHLREIYKRQDQALGEFLDEVSEDTHIIIVSDHGHGAHGHTNFHTNEWLTSKEYMTKRESKLRKKSLLKRYGVNRKNAIKLKNLLGIANIRDILPQRVFDLAKGYIPPADELEAEFDPSGINWRQTVAYSGMQNMMHITDDVPKDQKPDLRNQIIKELSKLKIPGGKDSQNLLRYAYAKEDIFHGPYYTDAPDIVFVADDMKYKANVSFSSEGIFTDLQWGEHRQEGVLMTAGPSFSSSPSCNNDMVDIKHVFPLVCAVTDVPAPSETDGEIPVNRLDYNADLTFREESHRRRTSERDHYSDTESEEIREQLDNLGYLQ